MNVNLIVKIKQLRTIKMKKICFQCLALAIKISTYVRPSMI